MLRGLLAKLYPPIHDTCSTDETRAQAQEALKVSKDNYHEIVANTPNVTEVVMALREQGERNHFAELLEASIRKSREV